MHTDSPYSSALALPLAGLGQRLAGAILDGMATVAAMVPSMLLMLVSSYVLGGSFDPDTLDTQPVAQMAVGLTFMGCLFLVSVVQWYLISTRGQSLGKIVVKTRIVRVDGSPVDFVTGVLLRSWVLGMVQGFMGIFCLGWTVPLMDGFVIFFGERRQCLHDHIASTVVVDASYRSEDWVKDVF